MEFNSLWSFARALSRQGEQAGGVLRCLPGHFIGGDAMEFSQLVVDKSYKSRLVAFASILLWREEGSVSFDEQAFAGDAGGDGAQVIGLLVGDRSGEAEAESQLERALRHLIRGGKGMQYAESIAQAGRSRRRPSLQNCHQIIGCFPVVEYDRQFQPGRQLKLRLERAMLG